MIGDVDLVQVLLGYLLIGALIQMADRRHANLFGVFAWPYLAACFVRGFCAGALVMLRRH
jgi:hypothetical protein